MDAEEGQAEFEPHRLLDQDRDAPGREQRIEQPAIEPAHHHPLDQEPEQRGDDEGERNGDEDVGAEPDARQHRDIGADHHHLAMGHVDHAHGAIGDRKPQRDQEQDRSERKTDEEDLEHGTTLSSTAPHARWMRLQAIRSC